MSTTTLHGELPPNVRDEGGVFGSKKATPASRLSNATARVARLKQRHSEAQAAWRAATEADDFTGDYRALKQDVSRLAHELADAEDQASQWQEVSASADKQNQRARFDEALKEVREARRKFAELFGDACLELGRWYTLGSEIRELVSKLADKMPTGHVYRPPHLTEALTEVDQDPNPLNSLKDAGFRELQTSQSWRRHCSVVPLAKPAEKEKS